MAAQVGALRVTLGANTAQFEAGMRRAQATARRTGQDISGSFRRAQMQSAGAMGAISRGAAAMGIAVTAIGATLSSTARQSFEYAASLGEASRAIGVTVEQYQILNRAALENGFSMETASRAIGILNRTLGQARAGSETAVRAFSRLGITREQIRSFENAGQALPVVMEALRGLRSQSEQAAAAQTLFGRSAAQMLPFLTQGARGYEEVAQAAREAGLITEEQARRADEASDRLAVLGLTLRTNLASALIDILPYIESVIRALGQMASAAAQAISIISSIRIPGSGQSVGSAVGNAVLNSIPVVGQARILGRVFGLGRGGGGRRGAVGFGGQANAQGTALLGTNALDMSSGGGGGRGRRGGGGGGGGAGAAQRALREQAEFQSELRRQQIELLRAQQERVTDSVARLHIDEQIAALERQEYEARLELRVTLGELTRAQAEQLRLGNARNEIEQALGRTAEQRRTVDQENRDIIADRNEIARDALQRDVDQATTARERREAELRLLELTHRQERARLEAVIATESSSRVEVQNARDRLAALNDRYRFDQQQARDRNRGPLGDFLADLPRTAAAANEALERIAVNGLESITDGLADAIAKTRSWGDVLRTVAAQALRDFARLQIQRGLAALFGTALSAKGVGALAAATVSGGKIPGRAAGGPVLPGRMYVVGEKGPELLRMGAMGGTVIPNGAGNGTIIVNQTFAPNFAGNAATKEDLVRFGVMVKQDTISTMRDIQRRRA